MAAAPRGAAHVQRADPTEHFECQLARIPHWDSSNTSQYCWRNILRTWTTALTTPPALLRWFEEASSWTLPPRCSLRSPKAHAALPGAHRAIEVKREASKAADPAASAPAGRAA
jgi:hypothetical protein